jgi:hypothetical protein
VHGGDILAAQATTKYKLQTSQNGTFPIVHESRDRKHWVGEEWFILGSFL